MEQANELGLKKIEIDAWKMMISYFHALQEHFSTHLTISHVASHLSLLIMPAKKREIIVLWRKLDNEQYTTTRLKEQRDPNKCSGTDLLASRPENWQHGRHQM